MRKCLDGMVQHVATGHMFENRNTTRPMGTSEDLVIETVSISLGDLLDPLGESIMILPGAHSLLRPASGESGHEEHGQSAADGAFVLRISAVFP